MFDSILLAIHRSQEFSLSKRIEDLRAFIQGNNSFTRLSIVLLNALVLEDRHL